MSGCALLTRPGTSAARSTRWHRVCARYDASSQVGLILTKLPAVVFENLTNWTKLSMWYFLYSALPAWLWGDPLHSQRVSCTVPRLWPEEFWSVASVHLWRIRWRPGRWGSQCKPTHMGCKCYWAIQGSSNVEFIQEIVDIKQFSILLQRFRRWPSKLCERDRGR